MEKMIRTKTVVFYQRMNIEMKNLEQLLSFLTDWNDDDSQDEVLLDAELNAVDRIGEIIKEMSSLQSAEWSALYEAKKSLQDPFSTMPTKEEEAEQNG